MKNTKITRGGFTMMEVLITIIIIAVLSVVVYISVGSVRDKMNNDKMMDDLQAIASALEDYRLDHNQKYPVPKPGSGSSQNILCFYEDSTYAHSCDKEKGAFFVQ